MNSPHAYLRARAGQSYADPSYDMTDVVCPPALADALDRLDPGLRKLYRAVVADSLMHAKWWRGEYRAALPAPELCAALGIDYPAALQRLERRWRAGARLRVRRPSQRFHRQVGTAYHKPKGPR